MTFADVVIEALNVTQDSVLVIRVDGQLTNAQICGLRAAFAPMFERGLKPAVLLSDDSMHLEALERLPRDTLVRLRAEVDRLIARTGK